MESILAESSFAQTLVQDRQSLMMTACLSYHKESEITPELDSTDLPEDENYQILNVFKLFGYSGPEDCFQLPSLQALL